MVRAVQKAVGVWEDAYPGPGLSCTELSGCRRPARNLSVMRVSRCDSDELYTAGPGESVGCRGVVWCDVMDTL